MNLDIWVLVFLWIGDAILMMLFGLLMELSLKILLWFEKNRFFGDLPISEARGESILVPLHKLWRSKAKFNLGCGAEFSVYFFLRDIEFLNNRLYSSRYSEKSFSL